MELSRELIARTVKLALAEDVGNGDATSLSTVPRNNIASAVMIAREPMVVAGLKVAEAVFLQVSKKIKVQRIAKEGQELKRGDVLLKIKGPAQAVLTAERVALNFAQRLSGIATLTAAFVQKTKGTCARILDTRKTTPGLRLLEKYAVACGGGQNHRIGLFDMILIKDNHLAALKNDKPNAIASAVTRARKKFPKLKVEVEADTLDQVEEALAAGADIILLDNMDCKMMKTAVGLVRHRAKLEASGGVNLQTAAAIAKTGVDYISVGAITHSARAVDIALDFEN
jgi:nicotinate-nucleotide pyrophosphorylase (carboxylating)